MNITEVRVKLLPRPQDKLRGFASITVDDSLVVRDIKVIEGTSGLFVAMPSRKLCDRCISCAAKNYIRARYCCECGTRLPEGRGAKDDRGRPRLYADIAHPINHAAREFVQSTILRAFDEELERSKKTGYKAVEFHDLDYEHYAE